MVTQTLIDYLKDENIDINKKKALLESSNLKYSELLNLKEMFGYNKNLYQILHGLIIYSDSNFRGKITYKNNKRKKGDKQKRMKKIRRRG